MIDVCVLSHNLPHLLCDFVDSLVAHEPPGSWRLIWVDNGSEPEAREQMVRHIRRDGQQLAYRMAFNDQNLGFTPAMNQALALSSDHSPRDYVCIANNDVVLLNPCLTIMREALDADPRLAAVGPMSVGGGWQRWQRSSVALGPDVTRALVALPSDQARADYLARAHRGAVWLTPRPGAVAFFLTLIRREVLEEVGTLDPRFGLGFGEDDQWCERAQRQGYEIGLAAGALAVHLHRATWRATFGEQGMAEIRDAAGRQLEQWREEIGG